MNRVQWIATQVKGFTMLERISSVFTPALILGFLLLSCGCALPKKTFRDRLIHMQAKSSFLAWNLTGNTSDADHPVIKRSLQLLNHSYDELNRCVEQGVGPSMDEMSGPWLGINKGVAATTVGWMQDVKVFGYPNETGRQCGFNVAVHQVPIDDLCRCGWRYQRDGQTNKPITLGNFVVDTTSCQSQCRPVSEIRGHNRPLRLDYRVAENKCLDPSRVLIDDLVRVDHDIVLGRASVCVRDRLVPIAFFTLFRRTALDVSCDDGSCCDSFVECDHLSLREP
jgi:hypothetical protein